MAREADGRFLAIIVEERPWGTHPDEEMLLREKVNNDATFILDGQYVSQAPDAAGHPVTIQLRCGQEPPERFAVVLEHGARQLEQFGAGFELKILDYLPTPASDP